MPKIKISNNRYIGEGASCFIVAEAGINHNGDIETAKKMVNAVKECGVDAVKFQTYKAEEFVSNSTEIYTYRSQGDEISESMLEMFERYEFSASQWREIFDYCKSKDILCFSTPQNFSDLDFLLTITDMPIIKVGSDDLTYLELLRYYASKGKPIIISAGMAFMSELKEAVATIKETGNDSLGIMHCVSSYPAQAEEINLRKMLTIKDTFDVVAGFSDHTVGTTGAVSAVALGAKIIEKHFTLDKNLPGPDHWFSADIRELGQLVHDIRYAEKALGKAVLEPTLQEMEMRKIARRSIIAARDITKGETITQDVLSVKRPGMGLPPRFVKEILNRRAKTAMKKGELIILDNIE